MEVYVVGKARVVRGRETGPSSTILTAKDEATRPRSVIGAQVLVDPVNDGRIQAV